MKVLAGLLGGFILAVLGALLATITFAAGGQAPMLGVGAFFVCWLIGLVIAAMAPGAAKAWRRLLITAAVFSFLLPLSGMLYTGSFMAKITDQGAGAAGATGAAIGGGLISGALGFVGFFLGIVFLVIGLLVGRDKQVVYVQGPPPGQPGQKS